MLPHPVHRARSRQSTSSSTTTNPTSAGSLHSWSMAPGYSGSSVVTSVWSDDGATVLPSSEEGKYGQRGEIDEERPLIELDSDPEPGFGAFVPASAEGQGQGRKGSTTGTKPSEELRRLLRQMEEEVKSSTPAPVHAELDFSPIKRPTSLPSLPPTRTRTPPAEQVSSRRANWREGRRIGVYPPTRDESSPEREDLGAEEEEEESPPTPPMRLTNPYLHTTRKVSDPGSSSKNRISSRAAVLQNSTSRSTPPPEPAHSPTPLETFIATHPITTPASSSRSPPHRSWSRKGKERESLLQSTPHSHTASRRSYNRRTSTSSSEAQHTPYRSPPETSRDDRRIPPRRTPRRYSIEIAPDDSEVFEREIEGMEVRGEVELDLDEDESGRLGRPWSEEGDGDGEYGDHESMDEEKDRRSGSTSIDRTHRLHPDQQSLSPNLTQVTQGEYKSPNRSKEYSSRLSRLLSAERSADISLPHLSEDMEHSVEEDEGVMSDRRAAMFRSGSRSRRSISPTPQKDSTARRSPGQVPAGSESLNTRTNQERSQFLSPENAPRHSGDKSQDRSKSSSSLLVDRTTHSSPSPAQSQPSTTFHTPPIRVGLAFTPPQYSTPQKIHVGETTVGGATPHPPGWLGRSSHTPPPSSAGPSARSVRFSPLRKTDKDWSVSMTNSSAEVSVHKLKLSPGRRSPANIIGTPSPLSSQSRRQSHPHQIEEGDTSFTSRLTRFLPQLPFSPSRLPKRSTTLHDAAPDLERLRQASETAQVKMEESKKAWSEALLSVRYAAGEGSEVVRRGMGWGGWFVWIGLEVLLLWGVFRVTLDFALSLNPSSNSFQTLNLNPHALSTRLPAALSAFVVPKHSANFFDLMERCGVWRRLESVLGAESPAFAGAGVKGGMMRMVIGGVPS